MRPPVRAALALAAGLLLLTSCSSSGDAGASASTEAPSPTPTPTPSSVVWAGDVCVGFDGVKTSVSALGSNLSYDVTSDRSALDQIDRQLRIQMISIGNSIDNLNAALATVPVDFVAANDLVVTLTKSGNDTKAAANEVTSRLEAAGGADNLVSAAAEIGGAVVAAKAAFEAGQVFVSAIGDATSTASGDLREAFDAAPECQDQ